jgi:hypothetical protein
MLRQVLEWFPEISDFSYSVLSSFAGWTTGGIIAAAIVIIEKRSGKPISWGKFRWVLVAFAIVSFYSAWHAQYRLAKLAHTEWESRNEEILHRDTRINSLQKQIADLQGNLNRCVTSNIHVSTIDGGTTTRRVAQRHQFPEPRKGIDSSKEVKPPAGARSEILAFDLDKYCKSTFGDDFVGDPGNPSRCLGNGAEHTTAPSEVCFWLYGVRQASFDAAMLPLCNGSATSQQPCSSTQRPCGADPSLCCPR